MARWKFHELKQRRFRDRCGNHLSNSGRILQSPACFIGMVMNGCLWEILAEPPNYLEKNPRVSCRFSRSKPLEALLLEPLGQHFSGLRTVGVDQVGGFKPSERYESHLGWWNSQDMGVSMVMGIPQDGWFIAENPPKMDGFWDPCFRNPRTTEKWKIFRTSNNSSPVQFW